MELTLVRHAIAEDGTDDFVRALTKDGKKKFAQCVAGLDSMGLRFSRLIHSPKKRAVQTAELLKPLVDGEVISTELLMKVPSQALLAFLAHDGLVAVGHEPHLSALVGLLVMGDVREGKRFEVKKGGVVRLEGHLEEGGMKVTGLWAPKVLRGR